MQDVRVYTDVWRAENEMKKWIKAGWRIHTCTITSRTIGYSSADKVLVVYERGEVTK